MLSITKDNYNIYKRVFEIIWLFQAQKANFDPNGEFSPIKVLEEWELKSMSLARRGLKEGLSDTLSQMVSLPYEYKNPLNTQLLSEGLPPLNTLISLVRDLPKKVLKKGRIKNVNEFYIIKEIVEDSNYEISDADRSRLSNMIGEFEINSGLPTNTGT